MRTVSARVEEEFGFAEMRLLSFSDLYAGKIVAALDRQHPRDLFDVRASWRTRASMMTCGALSLSIS